MIYPLSVRAAVAPRLARDSNHDRGRTLATAFDQGVLPQAHVLSNVLEEIYINLHARAGHQVATETLDALIESSGYEIVFTPKADFDAGRSLARKYATFSLTDAVIAAFTQREDIEYCYSFDDGFNSVDAVTRFVTAENPFDPE